MGAGEQGSWGDRPSAFSFMLIARAPFIAHALFRRRTPRMWTAGLILGPEPIRARAAAELDVPACLSHISLYTTCNTH